MASGNVILFISISYKLGVLSQKNVSTVKGFKLHVSSRVKGRMQKGLCFTAQIERAVHV